MSEKNFTAKDLNQHCLCKTIDKSLLLSQLGELGERPHLFSETSFYISNADFLGMKESISAIESTIHNPKFQESILTSAPSVSVPDFGPHGVFMGYDFHLTEEGPKLIEINTNAGGAYLNLLLARAQIACSDEVNTPVDMTSVEDQFFEMFFNEWRLQKGDVPLKTIGILDENPTEQYLYPEFKLFQELFQRNGIQAFIIDPKDFHSDKRIDLIYNRSTDFTFSGEAYASIKAAYLSQKVVLTPNPHHHLLYAQKSNLTLLTDHAYLQKIQLSQGDIKILLKSIPQTISLTDENRDELWKDRKKYFFKPTSGYGGKATYRGDKITTKVWSEMASASYVAQEFVKPSLRSVDVNGELNELKQDIRVYTYEGKVLLLASRLYSGQTTNFRTTGGGFAPVFLI